MPVRAFRISRASDFRRVATGGRSFFSPLFRLRYAPNTQGRLRYAVAVSLRVSKKATVRNRLRRRFSEWLRQHLVGIQASVDLVFSPSAAAIAAPPKQLEAELVRALQRLRLL